ncbi:MAG: S41 family peptidase [Chlamydiae bacterium]|nr:S41 family peptidase [Chlamydiota bacterium]
MLYRFLLTAVLCVLASFAQAKPPVLSPKDTKTKIDEILKAHVSHQRLSTDTIRRSFQNYLDEIDPGKTYLVESEITDWINPTEESLERTLSSIHAEDFTTYEQLHEIFLLSIERRSRLETKLLELELPKNVKPSDFKDLTWAKTEEELLDRLLRIKALQLSSAEKLNQETKDQFQQRLTKRRLNKEDEQNPSNPQERKQLVLSNVLKSVSSSLDSQTAYFTPAEANQFMIQVQQRLFGIGAQLRDDLDGLSIVKLLDGGPAILNGKIKLNDKIIAVDNEPILGMDISEAVELIRGQQGTSVNLTILRKCTDNQEEKLNIDIVRGEVVLKESRIESSSVPFGDGVIGIFHLFSFYQDNKSSSASDIAQAINQLKAQKNIKGVILDLRNNAGGLLDQAVAVTGLFIDKGVVVSIKDNTGQVRHLRNIENRKVWDGPLFVLTNRASASASEIVAQTLQDYGRAIVIGDDQTFGKGTFQTFTLESSHFGKVNPKGEYKVTRGRYYTVSGKSPQLTGVKADIKVPGIFSYIDLGEKFSKYPLEPDTIEATFEDNLLDVPSVHRRHIASIYKKSTMQTISSTYSPYLQILTENSKKRIELSKNYQVFLKEIEKKDNFGEESEQFGNDDLQLDETVNVMKDLIYLMEKNSTIDQSAA